ncbi:MAG TPA: hypothetical protein PLJ60_01840 [Chryseolinea sp.]|nr:hypothetical protein [Chryseolinea sp.]HPM29050.1 hypothetical protein [Chryseolinea sp.]
MKAARSCWLILLLIGIQSYARQNNLLSTDDRNSELILVFNQPQYAAGDTAFFKASIIERDLKEYQGTRIMNVALFKENSKVLYQRIVMSNSEASGYLFLNPEIQKGVYILVIELSGNYFESAFTISGEFKYSINPTAPIVFRQLSAKTNFGELVYRTNQDISVEIIIPEVELARGSITATIVKDSLFDQLNIMKCKQIELSTIKKNGNGFPEYFSGKVVDNKGIAISDSTKITFYLKDNDLTYSLITSKSGEFSFPLFKNFSSDEIFYTLYRKGQELQNFHITLDEVFGTSLTRVDHAETDLSDTYNHFVSRRKAIEKSYNFFITEKSEYITNAERDDILADHEVDLDRFEKFQTLSELINNIVPSVKYRKSARDERIRIFLKAGAEFANDDPVYIIDGVMTDSTKIFLSLDPSKIKTIKVLRSSEMLRRFGDLGKNGIIVVESKVPGGLYIPRSSKTFFVTGINKTIHFDNKVGKNANTLLPDVRSCLYWNPDLETTSSSSTTIKFNTGRITGDVKLIIEGISLQGQLFYFEKNASIQFTKK